MSCNKCGARTTRSRLCKHCGRAEHNDSRADTKIDRTDEDANADSETTVQILTLECGDCEHEFEIEATERHKCPACDYHGVRCLEAHEVLVT